MPHRLNFSQPVLDCVVGGRSIIDMPKLHIHSAKDAMAFIRGYGFDMHDPHQVERLWYFHRRALVLLQEKLGFSPHEIPEVLRDRKQLADITKLLLWASSAHPPEKDLQRWSCAILRAMHVFVHTESDLFSAFSEEIQKQILTPFQQCIYHEGTSGTTYLKRNEDGPAENEPLALVGFEVKPFKTSSSAVIKLLAKSDALAMNIFDKLGVRFVTRCVFDTFRVIRFLVEENLVSFPHIMPDQSSNNIYPVDLFCEVASALQQNAKRLSDEEIDRVFCETLEQQRGKIEFVRKENSFSGEDYKFIKFIARRLIKIHLPGQKESFSFFFPYEVQIMDQVSHQKILSGPSRHQAYKERQREAARKRVMGQGSAGAP